MFDFDSPLVCKGVIGDGCGGGRVFFVENATLFIYDPLTQERHFLVSVDFPICKISKNACVIILQTEEKIYKYDLSEMKIVE